MAHRYELVAVRARAFMPERTACSSGSLSKLPRSLSTSNSLYMSMPDLPCTEHVQHSANGCSTTNQKDNSTGSAAYTEGRFFPDPGAAEL